MKRQLSVVIPTFNNVAVLKRCLESWQRFASDKPVELVVIEDGCSDGTREYLNEVSATAWGRRFLRWFHEDDVNELRCNNRGFAESQSPLALVWQDDMFLRSGWLVDEIISTFEIYPKLGLLALSRGLNCFHVDGPIESFEDLIDWRRMKSTIGIGPLNWFRLHEVDIVVRPWVVRRACLDQIGSLDEAFCPHEFEEADYCYRLRDAGWTVATHGYERLGAYEHLGSSTISKKPPGAQQALALKNGLLFHSRWDHKIAQDRDRLRGVWWRRMAPRAFVVTIRQALRAALARNS